MTAIAAIYCRVSKKRNESISIESQESLLREYCKKNDFEIYRVYIDNGKSGKSTISRDDYLVLIDEAKQRKFNKVIIWRITRFGRNLKDLLYACDLFEQYDIALISYSENYDFSTAVGKLIRNIIGAVAEFELDEYSENIRMVLAEKAKNGGRMCHFVLGYDVLDKNSFIVNKEEKTVLLKMYSIAEQERSVLAATNKLNNLGITGKKGMKLTSHTLKNVLKRALYCGFVEHKGNLYKSDNIPVIISIERYNKMQIKLYQMARKKEDLFVILNNDKVLIDGLTTEQIEEIIRV